MGLLVVSCWIHAVFVGDHFAVKYVELGGRQRDVYPLLCLSALSDLDIRGVADADVTEALAYARALILVLKYGYGVAGPSPSAVYKTTVAQRTCLATLGARIHLFVTQLRSEVPPDVSPETWDPLFRHEVR